MAVLPGNTWNTAEFGPTFVYDHGYDARLQKFNNPVEVDASTGWNSAGTGVTFPIDEEGVTVVFANDAFTDDDGSSDNWDNFVFETVTGTAAGISLRADAYGWTYNNSNGNIPTYTVETSWGDDWSNFQSLTDDTEVTITAQKIDANRVTFYITFASDTAAWEKYTVTYPDGVPADLTFQIGADAGKVQLISVTDDNDYSDITAQAEESRQVIDAPAGDPLGRINTSEWATVTILVKESNMVMYVNGIQVYAATIADKDIITSDTEMYVGINVWSDTILDGEIDNLYVYDEAAADLTIEDILAATGKEIGTPPTDWSDKAEEVSVHDPSVVEAVDSDGTPIYYIFGSHMAQAKSKDLLTWKAFGTLDGNDQVLYAKRTVADDGTVTWNYDLAAALAESFEWAGSYDRDTANGRTTDKLNGTTFDTRYGIWAPDVIWNEDYQWTDGSGDTGAWMIYYSASSTYIRSAIGYAVARNIEGPYEYVDTIVYSGFSNNASSAVYYTGTTLDEDGVVINNAWFNGTEYNNALYPNAIDANLVYDKNGKLYMTYGSWAGGIYQLELDLTTGQPIRTANGTNGTDANGQYTDAYFGTRIAGGNYIASTNTYYSNRVSGEAPYVFYDAETGYYYLYVTYYGLNADGGYQMRLFRAESVNGPYEDMSGQPALYSESAISQADITSFGLKVMGNYAWNLENLTAAGIATAGYKAAGHNSVLQSSDGRLYLVSHTRAVDQGEGHQVKVHEMYMSETGWPLVAPFEYDGDIYKTAVAYSNVVVAGEYQLINHGYDNDLATYATPDTLTLNTDGTATVTYASDASTVSGTWSVDGTKITLTYGQTTYIGELKEMSDESTEVRNMLTISAVGSTGEYVEQTVWAVKEMDPAGTYVHIVNEDGEVLDDQTLNITYTGSDKTYQLSAKFDEGSQPATSVYYTWTSSDETIATVDAGGKVTFLKDGEVTITMTAVFNQALTGNVNADSVSSVSEYPVSVELVGTRNVNDTVHDDASDTTYFPAEGQPGSVSLDKYAIEQNYDVSGTAQINLDITGLPKNQPVDVILVMDVSRSMISLKNNGETLPNPDAARDSDLNILDYEKLNNLRHSAAAFVEEILGGSNTQNRIALVQFASDGKNAEGKYYEINSRVISYFEGSGSKEKLLSLIYNGVDTDNTYVYESGVPTDASVTTNGAGNGYPGYNVSGDVDMTGVGLTLSTAGGTNYGLGLKMAEKVVEADTLTEDRKKILVFMTDGGPSVMNIGEDSVFCDSGYSIDGDTKLDEQQRRTYYSTMTGVSTVDFVNSTRLTIDGVQRRISGAQKWTLFALNRDLLATQRLEAKGYSLISLGFDLESDNAGYFADLQYNDSNNKGTGELIKDDNGNVIANEDGSMITALDARKLVIQNVATAPDQFYTASTDNLEKIFLEIAESILKINTNVVIEDVIGDDFELRLLQFYKSGNSGETQNSKIQVIEIDTNTGTETVVEEVVFERTGTGATIATGPITATRTADGVILTTITDQNLENYTMEGEYFTYNAATKTFTYEVGDLNPNMKYRISYDAYLKGAVEPYEVYMGYLTKDADGNVVEGQRPGAAAIYEENFEDYTVDGTHAEHFDVVPPTWAYNAAAELPATLPTTDPYVIAIPTDNSGILALDSNAAANGDYYRYGKSITMNDDGTLTDTSLNSDEASCSWYWYLEAGTAEGTYSLYTNVDGTKTYLSCDTSGSIAFVTTKDANCDFTITATDGKMYIQSTQCVYTVDGAEVYGYLAYDNVDTDGDGTSDTAFIRFQAWAQFGALSLYQVDYFAGYPATNNYVAIVDGEEDANAKTDSENDVLHVHGQYAQQTYALADVDFSQTDFTQDGITITMKVKDDYDTSIPGYVNDQFTNLFSINWDNVTGNFTDNGYLRVNTSGQVDIEIWDTVWGDDTTPSRNLRDWDATTVDSVKITSEEYWSTITMTITPDDEATADVNEGKLVVYKANEVDGEAVLQKILELTDETLTDAVVFEDGTVWSERVTINDLLTSISYADSIILGASAQDSFWAYNGYYDDIMVFGSAFTEEQVLNMATYLARRMPSSSRLHETNVVATATYENVDGYICEQTYEIPQLAWQSAKVTYKFYLVKETADGSYVPIDTNNKVIKSDNYDDYIIIDTIYETREFLELMVSQEDALGETFADKVTDSNIVLNGIANNIYAYLNGQNPDGTYSIWHDGTQYQESVAGPAVLISGNDGTAKDTVIYFPLTIVDVTTNRADVIVLDYGLPIEIDLLANDTIGSVLNTVSLIGIRKVEGNLVLKEQSEEVDAEFVDPGSALNLNLEFRATTADNLYGYDVSDYAFRNLGKIEANIAALSNVFTVANEALVMNGSTKTAGWDGLLYLDNNILSNASSTTYTISTWMNPSSAFAGDTLLYAPGNDRWLEVRLLDVDTNSDGVVDGKGLGVRVGVSEHFTNESGVRTLKSTHYYDINALEVLPYDAWSLVTFTYTNGVITIYYNDTAVSTGYIGNIIYSAEYSTYADNNGIEINSYQKDDLGQYWEGVAYGSLIPTPFNSYNQGFYIGASVWSGAYMNAAVDGFKFYNTGLSASDVAALYNATKDGYAVNVADKTDATIYGNDGSAFRADGTDTTLVKTGKNTYRDAVGNFGTLAIRTADADSMYKSHAHAVYTMSTMMDGEDNFKYALRYDYADNSAANYVYGTLKVLPANNVYYEDNFGAIDYVGTEVTDGEITGVKQWQTIVGADAKTSQDFQLADMQGDDVVYGYDSNYTANDGYSNDTVTAISSTALAKFTFTGTGFDIVSRTNQESVEIAVLIKPTDTTQTSKMLIHNLYYDDGDLYQIPVISVKDLAYGEYTVQILARYERDIASGQLTTNNQIFYLDGIRIYNPLGTGDGNADLRDYYTDGEDGAQFIEIRNELLGENRVQLVTLGTDENGTTIAVSGGYTTTEYLNYNKDNVSSDSGTGTGSEGNVIIKDTATGSQKYYKAFDNELGWEDYLKRGPNNELYLSPGQAIMFQVQNAAEYNAAVNLLQVGAKLPNSTAQELTFMVDGEVVNTVTIGTKTEMYYDITSADLTNAAWVVIANTTDTTELTDYAALTNFKVNNYNIVDIVDDEGGDTGTEGGDSGTEGGDSGTEGGDSGTEGGDSGTEGGDTGTEGGETTATATLTVTVKNQWNEVWTSSTETYNANSEVTISIVDIWGDKDGRATSAEWNNNGEVSNITYNKVETSDQYYSPDYSHTADEYVYTIALKEGDNHITITIQDCWESGFTADAASVGTSNYKDWTVKQEVVETLAASYSLLSTSRMAALNSVLALYELEMIPGDEVLEAVEATVGGYSLSLKGNIAVNFYMDLGENVLSDEGAYVQFTLPNGTVTKVSVAEAEAKMVGGATYYPFSCEVAAKEMTDDIAVKVVLSDGRESETFTYAVKDYADYIIANEAYYSENIVALVKSMLNYGGYAQTQFGYNEEKMANEGLNLSLDDVTIGAEYKSTASGAVAGITYYGASLVLKSETAIKYYFTLADGADIADYSFTCNGEALEVTKTGNYYYVEIADIAAKDLDTMYRVEVTDGNDTLTVSFGALSYAKSVLESEGQSEALQNTVRALYKYWQAAEQYFGTR